MKKEIKVDWSKHLFRASGFGDLMAGGKELTERQKETIAGYEDKESLTTKQQETLDDLIKKRDTIELSKGAKTVLRKMRREIKFNRRKQLKSKYLKKGTELEELAIDFLSLHHDTVFTNNKERKEDEYFSGEADLVEGWDTKVAFELDTLPDPEEPLPAIYSFQNRIYMMLWDKKEWTTSSIVLNMMDSELVDVLYREGFNWEHNEVPEWKKIELIAFYIYDEAEFYRLCKLHDCLPNTESSEKAIDMFQGFVEIPDHERIVEKTVVRDKKIEGKMIKIAKLARIYLQEQDDLMSK